MSRKLKFRLAGAAVLFLAGCCLFLLLERVRGQRGLSSFKKEMSRKGEEFDLRKLVPPFPTSENGVAKLLAAAAVCGGSRRELEMPPATHSAAGVVVIIPKHDDLKQLGNRHSRTNLSWARLSEEVATRKDAIESALEALGKEHFWINHNYRDGAVLRLPHLARHRPLANWLTKALLVHLREGRDEEALATISGLIRLPKALENEPIVISQLVRIAVAHIAFSATWQALHAREWNDHQLGVLQTAWQSNEFLRPAMRAIKMSRATICTDMEQLRHKSFNIFNTETAWDPPPAPRGPQPFPLWFEHYISDFPEHFVRGVLTPLWQFSWSHQDELHFHRRAQTLLDGFAASIEKKAGTPFINEIKRDPPEPGPYDFLRYRISPTVEWLMGTPYRAWTAQTLRSLAITAVALERYRLRHGSFPAELKDLVPGFVEETPVDYMDGRPLRYRKDSPNSYLLYSVGTDGLDNGGDPATIGADSNILKGKDMVWPKATTWDELEALRKKQGRPLPPD